MSRETFSINALQRVKPGHPPGLRLNQSAVDRSRHATVDGLQAQEILISARFCGLLLLHIVPRSRGEQPWLKPLSDIAR